MGERCVRGISHADLCLRPISLRLRNNSYLLREPGERLCRSVLTFLSWPRKQLASLLHADRLRFAPRTSQPNRTERYSRYAAIDFCMSFM
jgi:hypothetical protein